MLNFFWRVQKHFKGRIILDCIDSINFYLRLVYFLAGLKLKKLSRNCKTIEELYNLLDSFQYTLFKKSRYKVTVKMHQKKEELIEFVRKIKHIKPKYILEIGTSEGGTLFFFSKIASPEAKIITIDLPIVRDYASYSPAKIPFYKLYRVEDQKIHFIRKDSHRSSTVKKVKKLLKNNKIDLLFIDGDHTYNGVKKDFENYISLVKENGIIGLHDIVEHPPDSNCNVFDFWNEIKGKYEYKEIISKDNEEWAGIGIIIKNKIL
jgi:predicted O-methyltransferase YrrM